MLLRRFFMLLVLALPFTLAQAADPVALHEDDITFVKRATLAGMMEVRACEAALKRNLTAEEQAFAKQLINDHQKANDELASIAKRKGLTPPSGLTADEEEKLSKMAGIKDKDFNEEFLEHQISCHKKSIDLFEDQAEDGKDADLKAFAAKHVPTLKAHLETAKRLEDKY
jgi:putative membrane protein